VPELGPSLGKLVTGSSRRVPGLDLDHFRMQLVTKVIESAGEARRLASSEEREAAMAALGKEAWLAMWEETVAAVSSKLTHRLNEHFGDIARSVNMPPNLRESVLLDESERRGVAARLGASGAGFISAVDAIEPRAAAVSTATGLERHALEAWQEALKLVARRLEAAWIELEASVDEEVHRWLRVARDLSRWRRPLWPVVVFGVVTTAVALWLGLIAGGFVTVPEWVRALLAGVIPA
jgi:hypothetical protein